MEPRPRATRDDVETTIREIRQYHHEGRRILRDVSMHGGYAEGSIKAEAGRRGWNETKARKARQFAEPSAGYSEERLDELCRLLREHRPHVGTSHLSILVTVPWPERAELQRRCIEEDWSKSELEAEIKRRFGSRRQGGRRRQVRGRDHAMVQLEEMADSWQRWFQIATEERNGKARAKTTLLDALPEPVRIRARLVNRAMLRLREAVSAELELLRARHHRQTGK